MMRRCASPLAGLLVAALMRCSNGPTLAGNTSSETTNGFYAVISNPDGTPAAGAVVRIRLHDYLADTNSALGKSLTSSLDAVADDSGRFSIDSLQTGKYLIEAFDTRGNAVAIPCTTSGDSLVDLGAWFLSPMGKITGTAGGPAVRGFVRICGLERCVMIDSVGRFDVQVPANIRYRINVITPDTSIDTFASSPVRSSTVVTIAADAGTRRTDSLAIRAFLDALGLGTVPVNSATPDLSTARIRNLDLSDRGLTSLPASVGDLSFLWGLNLSKNPLRDLPETLDRIPLLAALNLNSTPISALPSVVNRCVYLQWLHLDGTGIRDLPPELANLTLLHELWMAADSLTSVPTAVFSLRSLKSLCLSRNSLTKLPAAIGNLDSLEYLHINDNLLDSLPASLSSLTRLKVIYAFRNRLSSLPDSIGKLKTLTRLEVQDNRLAQIPASIGQCANLRFIHLFNNQLASLPMSIINLQPFEGLSLGWNRLCNLPPELFVWADTYAEKTWKNDQTCP